MGTWGLRPWDNDEAADWFDGLFTATGLAERVEECLKRDPRGNMAEIRAAAYVVFALGRHYIWPLENLGQCLDLAVARLREIRRMLEETSDDEYGDVIDAIAKEIDDLTNRQREYAE